MHFKNRDLLIATKHKKESVIAPVFSAELGTICSTTNGFDTDQFGTFTGEIERTLTGVQAAKEKCLKAMALYEYDMCVASEGSFGPHPNSCFIPVNCELMIFIDLRSEIEVVEGEMATETNFASTQVDNVAQLEIFAKQALFPSHALIMSPPGEEWNELEKGITDERQLKYHFQRFVKKYGAVHIETDMRAAYNPSRMVVIKRTAQKLVNRIKSHCPECKLPGFGITVTEFGLPCKLCRQPTRSILKYLSICKGCNFKMHSNRPDEKINEDPMFCDFCNP